MKRFLLILTIAALFLALIHMAPPASAQDVIVIKQWYHQYGEDGVQDAVTRYADEYNKLNPNIKIEITWVPGDYGTKLSAALLTADGPDVFESQPTVDKVTQGLVAPLDDLYTPDIKKDFNPNNIAAATVNGKIYGIKMIDDTGAFYYRKSVFAKAGITPPKTFDDLLAAAKKLTAGNQKGLFIGNDGGANSFFAKFMIWSAGDDIIKDNKAAFNNDRGVLAVKKLKELNDSGVLLIGAPTDWWDPSVFVDGLAPIQFNGLWAMPAIKKALGDDFGVFAWPALDNQGTPTTWYGGWTAFASAKSQHLAETKAYLKWLWLQNTTDQIDFATAYGFHVPPRASVAAQATALKDGPAKDMVDILTKYGKIEGGPQWTGAMDTFLSDAVANIIKNGADPKTELDTAAQKINAELANVVGAAPAATMAPTQGS
jgi:multiple sugar transport system substrate-binding protein